jgi:hypothetical protein
VRFAAMPNEASEKRNAAEMLVVCRKLINLSKD